MQNRLFELDPNLSVLCWLFKKSHFSQWCFKLYNIVYSSGFLILHIRNHNFCIIFDPLGLLFLLDNGSRLLTSFNNEAHSTFISLPVGLSLLLLPFLWIFRNLTCRAMFSFKTDRSRNPLALVSDGARQGYSLPALPLVP